jgi:hypothetical protein
MDQTLHKSAEMRFILTGVLLLAFFAGWMVFGGAAILLDGKELGDVIGYDGGIVLDNLRSAHASLAQKLGAWLLVLKNDVTYLAAFLPALGAALASIRETGVFDKVSERSMKTAASLRELQHEVTRARSRLTIDETGDILLSGSPRTSRPGNRSMVTNRQPELFDRTS